MLEALVRSIENTFVQFSYRRLLYVIFLTAILGFGFYVFNELTGYTYFSRLDKQINVLDRLLQLEKSGVSGSADLAPLYDSLLASARSLNSRPFDIHFPAEPFVKFLAAAWLPVVFIVAGLFQMLKRKPEGGLLFGGALILTLLLGLPAVLLPTWHSLGRTVVLFTVAQVVVIGAIMRTFGRNRAPADAYVASLKSDLRNLVTAQEAFFADHVRYAKDVGELSYETTRGNEIRVLQLTADGWYAVAGREESSLEYGIRVGAEGPAPFSSAREGQPFRLIA